MNQATATGKVGETKTLKVTVKPENATDKDSVLGAVSWTTSSSEVATVSNGTVTLVKEGTATITATSGDFSTTCKVTVNAA